MQPQVKYTTKPGEKLILDAPAERVLADTVQVSSLAETGSKSGHRYGKFTKAKDLTGASAKHLEVTMFFFQEYY